MNVGTPRSLPARARDSGLMSCHECRLVFDTAPYCPRCGSRSHARKPFSLQRTLAYLLTATLLYIPANLLPIFETTSLGQSTGHTIVGGVLELLSQGSWDLALIVFVASVVVPVLKIVALVVLSFIAGRDHDHHRSTLRRVRQRGRLYRVIESIGHWSMLDIYVVALLVALVQFEQFMTVRPQGGAIAFGAVVVLTMLASASFDPRLLWDHAARDEEDATGREDREA